MRRASKGSRSGALCAETPEQPGSERVAVWGTQFQAEEQRPVGCGPGAAEGQEGADFSVSPQVGRSQAGVGGVGNEQHRAGARGLAKAGSTTQGPRTRPLLSLRKSQGEAAAASGRDWGSDASASLQWLWEKWRWQRPAGTGSGPDRGSGGRADPMGQVPQVTQQLLHIRIP